MATKPDPQTLLREALCRIEESAALLLKIDSANPAALGAIATKVAELRRQVAALTRTMKAAPDASEPESEAGG